MGVETSTGVQQASPECIFNILGSPPPQSSIPTAHHLGVQLHEFSPFLLEFLTAFIFYRLCTNSHSYCEFMCATVLALSYPPKNAFVKMSRSGSDKFLVPSSAMMLSLEGRRCYIDDHLELRTPWSFVLCMLTSYRSLN